MFRITCNMKFLWDTLPESIVYPVPLTDSATGQENKPTFIFGVVIKKKTKKKQTKTQTNPPNYKKNPVTNNKNSYFSTGIEGSMSQNTDHTSQRALKQRILFLDCLQVLFSGRMCRMLKPR